MRGFVKLLQPLSWCHLYIPVLPRTMLDHLQCPTPFMMGINKSYAFKHDFPYSVLDVAIVDLDEGSVQLPEASPICLSPAARSRSILEIKQVLNQRLSGGDLIGAYSGDKEAVMSEFPLDHVKGSFRKLVESLLESCDAFVVSVEHGTERELVFKETEYAEYRLSMQLPSNENFLRTQAFSRYITSRFP